MYEIRAPQLFLINTFTNYIVNKHLKFMKSILTKYKKTKDTKKTLKLVCNFRIMIS